MIKELLFCLPTISHFIPNTSSSSAVITANGKSSIKTIANAVNLQDVASKANGGCPSTLSTTTTYTLKDTRDGQSYQVARLADGNCWMITNLNLGAVTLTQDLTSDNTNLVSPISATTFNGWKKANAVSGCTSPDFYPSSGIDSTSLTPYGTYYSFCALTAQTYCYSCNGGHGNATYDICPAGWRLPTGGTSSEYATLYNYYNSYNKMRTPVSESGAAFALTGVYNTSGISGQGNAGRYWTSSQYPLNDRGQMFKLYIDSSRIDPANEAERSGGGFTARCILK